MTKIRILGWHVDFSKSGKEIGEGFWGFELHYLRTQGLLCLKKNWSSHYYINVYIFWMYFIYYLLLLATATQENTTVILGKPPLP